MQEQRALSQCQDLGKNVLEAMQFSLWALIIRSDGSKFVIHGALLGVLPAIFGCPRITLRHNELVTFGSLRQQREFLNYFLL
jgi:hypothetical protein